MGGKPALGSLARFKKLRFDKKTTQKKSGSVRANGSRTTERDISEGYVCQHQLMFNLERVPTFDEYSNIAN